MTGELLGRRPRPGVYVARKFLKQPVKQALLGQSDNREIFHTEKIRCGTKRVFRIDHDNAPLGELSVLFDQAGDINLLGEDFIRQLQISL